MSPAREDPRRRRGGAAAAGATGEAGVRTMAEGIDGRSLTVVVLDELEDEDPAVTTSSDIDLDSKL